MNAKGSFKGGVEVSEREKSLLCCGMYIGGIDGGKQDRTYKDLLSDYRCIRFPFFGCGWSALCLWR